MIQVQNLVYQYPKNVEPTLKGLSFAIEKGEIFGFLGPSGAGKSTALKVLYKVLNNYKGSISIKGKDLTEWDNRYFEKIGVGFELPNHYLKLTGRENLDLFASFYPNVGERNVDELFEIVGLTEAKDKTVQTYSKGMKMRLNFIRAIQHDPEILFFDEPTTGMDPGNAHKIKEQIKRLRGEGKTIFIATHNMHTADELCDRISFIINGMLDVTDTPQNLKSQYGREAVIVESVSEKIAEFPLKDLGANHDFLSFIRQQQVKRIHTQEATLEEVFLQVTGKSLFQ